MMMLIGRQYAALIAEREKVEGDIDYDSNPVIKEMIALLTGDIRATIVFLDTECSESEFIWMSEIFDEIAERTKSREFIEALRRTAKKYPKAVKLSAYFFYPHVLRILRFNKTYQVERCG